MDDDFRRAARKSDWQGKGCIYVAFDWLCRGLKCVHIFPRLGPGPDQVQVKSNRSQDLHSEGPIRKAASISPSLPVTQASHPTTHSELLTKP